MPCEKNHILHGKKEILEKVANIYAKIQLSAKIAIGGIFSSGMAGNKCIGRNFFKELINVWYGIRGCWVENFMKIN